MTGRVREWWERAVGFVRGRRPDHDLEAELVAHIEMAVEDNLRSGMSQVEARRVAAMRLGSQASAKEEVSDQRGLPGLESLCKDLSYAFRGMRKRPTFTGVVVLTVALGIGANTALFSLVETVMLRRLPVRDPQQLFFLQNVGSKGANGAPPYPCFGLFRERTQAFDGMTAVMPETLDLVIDGRPAQISGELVSSSYFEVLGVNPAIGRLLTASDDQLQPPVAVIGYGYWQRRFGGDSAVLGKVIRYKRYQLTIVGVIEEGFLGMTPGRPTDVALPFTVLSAGILREKANWGFDVVARLKPGVSIEHARAQVDGIFQDYMTFYPRERRRDYFDHMELAPAAKGLDTLRSRFSRPLLVMMALVGLVLLVGCANLASLLMAHTDSRRREFAVRLAIGAGCGRLVRQLLTEILLLFGFGAAFGLVFAVWGSRFVVSFLAVEGTPVLIEPQLDARVMAFTAGVAVLAGLIFGVLPVLGVVRTAPYPALHGFGNRATDSRARIGVRQMLVVAQVALSLILLVGAGLFVRTLANLDRLDLGFRPQGVLTLNISPVLYMTPAGASYTDERLDVVWAELLERVRAIPGVRSASLSWLTPLSGRDRGVLISVPGGEADPYIGQNHVSDGYFETFGIPVLAGRTFARGDRVGAPKVAIINETAAKFYFGGRNPIGVQVQIRRRTEVFEIVGVVRDAKHLSLREEAPRFIYIPVAQRRDPLRRLTMAIKTSGNPASLAPAVEREVQHMGADILVTEVTTAGRQLEASLLQERLLSTLSGFLGFLALALSAVGLFGLLTLVVRERTAEIGIRIALGADPGSVVCMILRRSLLLVAIGVAVGVPAALLAARPLASLLYGLETTDAATVAAGVSVLAATAMLASYIPARRASRIDPTVALRNE